MAYSSKMIFIFMSFFSFYLIQLSAYEFQAGDKDGWRVPSSNHTNLYNEWSSENRFKVGDTIRFRYKKDSVMEVNESDYNKCDSSRPMLFSNTGNTVYKLDRSGPFYFISGSSGHCQKGQHMIVRVMSNDDKSKGHKPFGSQLGIVMSCVVVAQLLSSYLFKVS